MCLVLRFHIADLCVYVLFKCTYDLFESSELLLHSLVSCCNAFDHDRFNFLNLSPVIVQFSLYSLLPPVHCRLYAIHHIFKLFVLLGEQSLLVTKRYQVLFFGPFNDVIHRD